jgi:hypothetical protein
MNRLMLHLGVGLALAGADTTLPLAIAAARDAEDLLKTLLQDHDRNEREPCAARSRADVDREGAVEARM